MDTFATLLKKYIKNSSLNLSELAKKMGIPKDSIEILLDGLQQPQDCDTVIKYVEYLGLKTEDRRALFKAAELDRCFFALIGVH